VFDPSDILEAQNVQVREDLTMEVQLVGLEDRRVEEHREKTISLVKVTWDKRMGDSTWELEEDMRKAYPHLFSGKS